jgi:signal transduction histidine kinase
VLNSRNISIKRKTTAFPFLILAVLIMLTFGITYSFYQSSKNKDLIRFNNEVIRVQAAFENRLNLYISLLKGGRGFVESVGKINRKSFANYVKSLEIDKNYSGIQGIGYSKVILPEEREDFINQMKSEDYTDFKMFPEGKRDVYQAIIYLEPLDERNQLAIGYDMSTEENRREALDRARDSGKVAATAKITLVQETTQDKQFGFLIYFPVYKNGQMPVSIEERRKNLDGFIYSPFRAGNFLKEIQTSASANNIGIAIYDGDVKSENLMAQTSKIETPQLNSRISENQISALDSNESYNTESSLEVAGENWKIKYFALPTFDEQSSVGWTPLIFLSGIGFSFLLFGMMYWEASSRAKLEVTAAELFELEKQKQTLLENEQKARLIAEKANSTKDEFLAVVSHELRTPLNAIAGWTSILKTNDISDNTKELALGKIEKNIRTQTKLVEELLDYSQILAGNSDFAKNEFEFVNLVKNSVNEIEPLATEKNIKFINNNKLNGEIVVGDEGKLSIAIQNLLLNAIKFTESGGKIEIMAFVKAGKIVLSIKDDGRGISEEFLPHIFDRFRQADGSITRSAGGLGLGLTISNQIIKLHQGKIEVNSEGSNKGSIFTITLPCKK